MGTSIKAYWLLPLIFLLTLSSPSLSGSFNADTAELSTVLDPAVADHLVLIGFPDQSINPVESASSKAYRRRGGYQSSGWSQRLSQAIAEDYHIRKLTEWPMSEAGVHCIVYQVPAGASVPETMKRLSQDTRVRIVQNMHLFKTETHQYNDPYFKLQANLQQMQIGQAHGKTTGKNITIAMIDTGVDLAHPDLLDQSGAKILNMSLTGPQDTFMELLLNKAIEKGMIVIAADTGLGVCPRMQKRHNI